MINHIIPYGRQYITDEDIQVVVDTLKSDYLTQGPKIAELRITLQTIVEVNMLVL